MKLHLPTTLRAAVMACFSAVCALSATLATGTITGGVLYAALVPCASAAYEATSATFSGTDNAAVNPTADAYAGASLLIFDMAGTGSGNYLSNDSWTYAGNIQIGAEGATETGLCLNNGYRNRVQTFSGKVTGTGLLSKTGAGTNLALVFEGDVTEFTGAIKLGASAMFTLQFGGGGEASENATAEHGVSGTGDISFVGTTQDNLVYHYESSMPVYVTNRITTATGATSIVQFNGASSYVLTKDAAISQLSLGAGASLHVGTSENRAETVVGALTMGEGAAVHVDNGLLSLLEAESLGGCLNVGEQGLLALGRTTSLAGALNIAEGGALSLASLSGFRVVEGGRLLPAEGENGFATVKGKVQILTGDAEQLQTLAGAKVLYDELQLELAEDGTVTLDEVDYSSYYLRHGEASLEAMMEEAGQKLMHIEVSSGSGLAVTSGAVQGVFRFAADCSLTPSSIGTTITGETSVEHLFTTEKLTISSGATLRIGSTAESSVADIDLNSGAHLIFAAAEPTEMRVGAISNSGDRRDDFRRTVLVEQGVKLRAASLVNSWGLKSLTVNGELTIDGILQYSTGNNDTGTNLITGAGSVTAESLNISNWSASNTIDVRSLLVTGTSDISRETTICGGEVTLLGNTSLSAPLNISGGSLVLGDAVTDVVTLNGNVNLSSGGLTLNGTTTLGGHLVQTDGELNVNGALTMNETLTVSGTVNLDGTLRGLTRDLTTNGTARYSEGNNGFRETTFHLFEQGNDGFTFHRGEESAIIFDGVNVTDAVHRDTAGNIVFTTTPQDIYYLNIGRESLSHMLIAGEGQLNSIIAESGATLVADMGDLQGTLNFAEHCNLEVSEFSLSTTINADMQIEQLSASRPLTIGGGVTLTIGSTAENSAVDMNLNADAHLVFASSLCKEMRVGTINNNGDSREDYQRTMLVGSGVTLQATSIINSWGMKSLTVNGTLNVEDTLRVSTSANEAGTNLITGSGELTVGKFSIGNYSTTNVISVHSFHVLGEANFGCNTAITDGTMTIDGRVTTAPQFLAYGTPELTVAGGHLVLGSEEHGSAAFLIARTLLSRGSITCNGDTTMAGQYSQTGGTLTLNGALALNNKNGYHGSMTIGGGEFVLNGTAILDSSFSQTGGTFTINGMLSLKEAVTASGTLSLNGTLDCATADMGSIGAVTYSEGENGFREGRIPLFLKGENELKFTLGESGLVRMDGEDVTSFLTTDASGNVILSNAADGVYYLNSGSKALSAMVPTDADALRFVRAAQGTSLQLDTGDTQGLLNAEETSNMEVTHGSVTAILAGQVHMEQLAVSSELALGEGVTLSIGSTAAGNVGNINLGEASHLIFASEVESTMSVGSLLNTYGEENDFRRTISVGENVSLTADALVNSWGLASLTVDGSLDIRGSLSYLTGSFFSGGISGNKLDTNCIAGAGSITADSLTIGNSSDSNNISVHSLTISGNSTISREMYLSGGTTSLLGTTSISGPLNFRGGHLILGDEQSDIALLSGAVDLAEGELTLNGTTTLSGSLVQGNGQLLNNGHLTVTGAITLADFRQTGGALQVDGDMTLSRTLTDSGSVTLNGTLHAASSSLTTIGTVHYSEGVNGYAIISYILFDTEGSGVSFSQGADAKVLLDGGNVTSCLTTDDAGRVILRDAQSTIYHIFSDTSVYGGVNSDMDVDYTDGIVLHGGTLKLEKPFTGEQGILLQGDATINIAKGIALSADSLTGIEHLRLDGAGTYVVSDLAQLTASSELSSRQGVSRIIAPITIESADVAYLSSKHHLQFRHESTEASDRAVSNYGEVSIVAGGCVEFSRNISSNDGAGLYNRYDGTFLLRGNEDVEFCNNETNEYRIMGGGAVFNYGNLSIVANRRVNFSRNSSVCGGAIFDMYSGSVSLVNNGSVTFSDNFALDQTGYACGGAIDIYDGGPLVISGNESVSFIRNTAAAQSASASAEGGAISNGGSVKMIGNGTIVFRDNSVSTLSRERSCLGGAISNLGGHSPASLTISGNGDVLFERNAEISDGSYRLRSIYSTGTLNLSATSAHSITFRDSVYAEGEVYLNLDGAGDIIFTGATTESDMIAVKGLSGTDAEIRNSRTSEIATVTHLGGGRLVVQDKAVLAGQGITVAEDSGATVRVKDGTLNHADHALTFLRGTTLEAEGVSRITASSVDMAAGSTLSIVLGETNLHNAALTLTGTLTTDTLSLAIGGTDKLKAGTYTLLRADDYDTATWTKENITILTDNVRLEDLVWQGGLLTYCKVVKELSWEGSKGILSADSAIGSGQYEDGTTVNFHSAASVTVSGAIAPGDIVVDSADKVTFTSDKKKTDSGIGGAGSVTKSGVGVLTLNAGNTYSGGTELNEGTIKATAADSFGTGDITVNGGTLDLGSKAVANDIILSGAATLKGDAKYAGNVTVDGKATLLAKTSYKGTTTIGEDSSLTLTSAATLAGNVALEGGTLTINNAKGMTLAKTQTMMLDGGEVRGLVTVGAGGTLAWQEGTMQNAPVLKGGTLDLGGKNALTLTGVKAQVQFGDKVIDLPGKGIVRSDETLDVLSGTVKLTAGAEHADIKVSGNAALVNGATHSGDITVDGTLAKGTTIKLIDSKQTVELNGKGTMAGTISGVGSVNVNESIDATAAKLTAAAINLNSGTFINTKGIKLVKDQTLTLNGANVNLGAKGILTTAAGSTLKVSESATLSGSLTLGGGELVFDGAALTVKGTLTLSKPVSVTGSGTLICDSVKPFKGDLGTLFGGADVKLDGTTLTINGGATKKSLVAAPVAEEEAPLVATPALPTLPEMPATNPVADAIAQADWGILDANRAFTGAVATRHQHAALLDKGRGAAWVSAFGSSVRHGNQGAHHGSDGNIEGAALGMEHSVFETGILGLAVGRSKNRIGATGVTHLRQETAHVALYGQKQFKYNLTADATAAWGDTETKLGGSSWQQKSAALSGRLTHAHMVNDVTAVRTFGGLSYEATDSASIGSGSVQNLRAEVGAGATHTAGKAHFYGEAALTGDLIRHNPSVELDGLRHHGATPGRLGVKGTFGALYSFTDTWTGTASYSIEAESRTTSHTLNLGVSKSF